MATINKYMYWYSKLKNFINQELQNLMYFLSFHKLTTQTYFKSLNISEYILIFKLYSDIFKTSWTLKLYGLLLSIWVTNK